jgi:hypothetical protein
VDDSETIDIGIQLAAAAGMMLVMTFVHGLGLEGLSRLFRLEEDRLARRRARHVAMLLTAGLAVSLFVLHTAEIWLFAAFSIAIRAVGSWEAALFESASSYATLGFTTARFPTDWHLLVAFEGLIGFLLIGWSTAFIVTSFDKIRHDGGD